MQRWDLLVPSMQMLIMERKAVATHYLKGWFALDVLASFPLDLIFAGKRMDMWRLPRLLKVIRVLNYKSLSHACEAPLLGSLHQTQNHCTFSFVLPHVVVHRLCMKHQRIKLVHTKTLLTAVGQ